MVEQGQQLAVLQRLRQLEGFGAQITVHAPASSALAVSAVCEQENLGAVYTTPTACSPASRLAQATAVVRQHATRTGSADAVLIDAQLYTGKRRILGTEPHDLQWTVHQHQLGLPWALTDSGYIGDQDLPALQNTLGEGGRHAGQTIVALPLHYSWLAQRADQLKHQIETAGLPVALMLEHDRDPFGVRKTVQGLVEVLDSRVPIGLLRCDISAVGALAHGAVVAAVGTKTSLRHIYPSKAGGGGGRPASIAAIVPRGLLYKQLDRIREAVVADGDQTHWTCQCTFCAARSLDWLITSQDAFQHSLATLAALTDYVLSSPNPRGTWKEKCRDAQFVNIDIETTTGLDWQAPPFLGHWLNV